jgi:hypothetical protein
MRRGGHSGCCHPVTVPDRARKSLAPVAMGRRVVTG